MELPSFRKPIMIYTFGSESIIRIHLHEADDELPHDNDDEYCEDALILLTKLLKDFL